MNVENIKQKTQQEIKYYKQIDSTHMHAKKVEEQGDMVLIAEVQTAGIGTKGRSWHTGENENIAMTIIKHPICNIEKLEGLTTQIAEAIKESIKELYGYDLKIKMPNDLILNGKKISGILTEIHTQGKRIKYLLISIGFNVNEDEFAEEIDNIATSLKKEYKKNFNREEIIIKIINKIENIVNEL